MNASGSLPLRVWPDAHPKTSAGKFRLMRNTTNRKYQNITIMASSRMAQTLHAEFSSLLAFANNEKGS